LRGVRTDCSTARYFSVSLYASRKPVFHTSSGGQFPLATLGASRLSFTGTLAFAEMFLCAGEMRAGCAAAADAHATAAPNSPK
jgi:hypothetical protein